ncbi:PRC-barrel domain-containing protein [Histidinibacterium lentulum]|uniref:PRC-barrel domain containing protein n=1 Tax=Histidinibacterium lentulum TaxID=2480588 RepID=A0A3N2QSF8_9RHOB|nr:PRC-barrel domain-containing protein [Histidinibacterium lentulum]ROT98100.1 PRC-barrel domain containing protein [Histidinibacterium lentulum]
MTDRLKIAASALALVAGAPAMAQDDMAQDQPEMSQDQVEVLSGWNYDTLYETGWSVENMFDLTEIRDANGEDIGDVENVIFANDGEVLGIIAQVGGFWDIGDTHVYVPWDQVEIGDTIQVATIPVTEETVDDYTVFGEYWFEEETLTEAETEETGPVNDDLEAGSGIFKATDMIGSYAYLTDGVRYGYVADLIVQDDAVSAIVTDAAAYGTGGYYAYPYAWRGTVPTAGPRYDMPYGPQEVDTLEAFDYEQLQTRGTVD